MIKSILAIGASAAALALATPAFAQEDTSEETAMPTMSFGTWGVDPATLDPARDPGDDFFAYVNAKWLAANPLPAEFSRFGAFNLLREKSTTDVKDLVDALVAENPAPGTSERRIVDAYQAFVDTAAIDAAGMAPINPYLYQIYEANSLDKLAMLWGKAGMPARLALSSRSIRNNLINMSPSWAAADWVCRIGSIISTRRKRALRSSRNIAITWRFCSAKPVSAIRK